jgi:hypothetical protein
MVEEDVVDLDETRNEQVSALNEKRDRAEAALGRIHSVRRLSLPQS